MSLPFRVMGIVNVTPDSFSDGGLFLDARAAIAHARELVAEGADIVDVGGESTRPGAEPVSAAEELRRVLPAVAGLAGDLTSPARRPPARWTPPADLDRHVQGVRSRARRSMPARASSTTSARCAPTRTWRGSSPTAACECCLMHMLGEPRTMQRAGRPRYEDVVDDVRAFLEERLAFAVREGVREERDHARPGDRLRQDGRAQPRAAAPPGRAGRNRAARWSSAPRARASSGASSPPTRAGESESVDAARRLAGTIATNVLALRARCERVPGARRRARCATRWPWLLLRWASDGRRGAADDDADELEDDEPDLDEEREEPPSRSRSRSRASRSTPTTASARPSARSASGWCSTCAGRRRDATPR